MIVLRNKLYYASLNSDLENEILYPVVPNNEFSNHKIGDYKTPRICFYPTPSQAISALGLGIQGKVVYLYSPLQIRPESKYRPTIQEAPFRDTTGEIWDLTTSRVHLVGRVKISGPKKKEVLTYYNPRATSLTYITWGWLDLETKMKKEKVVYISTLDKPSIQIPGGTQLFRKLEDAIKDKKEGEIFYTYKPESGKVELPETLIAPKKLMFKRAGKILVTSNTSYKTL